MSRSRRPPKIPRVPEPGCTICDPRAARRVMREQIAKAADACVREHFAEAALLSPSTEPER